VRQHRIQVRFSHDHVGKAREVAKRQAKRYLDRRAHTDERGKKSRVPPEVTSLVGNLGEWATQDCAGQRRRLSETWDGGVDLTLPSGVTLDSKACQASSKRRLLRFRNTRSKNGQLQWFKATHAVLWEVDVSVCGDGAAAELLGWIPREDFLGHASLETNGNRSELPLIHLRRPASWLRFLAHHRCRTLTWNICQRCMGVALPRPLGLPPQCGNWRFCFECATRLRRGTQGRRVARTRQG
jgi:hypothetical protein